MSAPHRKQGDLRVVSRVGVLALGKTVNKVEFLLGKSNILSVKLVLDSSPTKRSNGLAFASASASATKAFATGNVPSSIGILDALQELVQLVSLSRTHDLLAVNVVADVRHVVVKVGGDVADAVGGLR